MRPREDRTEDTAADEIVGFWEAARGRAGVGRLSVITGSGSTTAVAPPAWAFGSTPEEADELLALVLAGAKTATASAHAPYVHRDEPVPRVGDLSIVLDGARRPQALVRTTSVRVVPFGDVDAAHAAAEGEGDLGLDHWRAVHAEFLGGELAEIDETVGPTTPVVLERFELLYPRRRTASTREDVRV